MLIYTYRQHTTLKPQNIIIKRNIFIFKNHVNNKKFYIHVEYADIFDCVFKEYDHIVTYPASYQKFLERGIAEEKETPLELFNTEEVKLSELYG